MKRMLSTVTASVFLVTATLYPAMAAPSSRTATASYGGETRSIMISLDNSGAHISVASSDPVPVQNDERSVTVEIADASGEPVVGLVHQGKAELGVYCGETESFSLANRRPVHIHMITGFSTDCMTVSNPTEGTVKLTFSN